MAALATPAGLPSDFTREERELLVANEPFDRAGSKLTVGSAVIACYGGDNHWYRGKIHRVGNDRLAQRKRGVRDPIALGYYIQYDDGDFEQRSREKIRLLIAKGEPPDETKEPPEGRSRRSRSRKPSGPGEVEGERAGAAEAPAATRTVAASDSGGVKRARRAASLGVANAVGAVMRNLRGKDKVAEPQQRARKGAASRPAGAGKARNVPREAGAKRAQKRRRMPPAAASAAAKRAARSAAPPAATDAPRVRTVPATRCHLYTLRMVVEARALSERQLACPGTRGVNGLLESAWLRKELLRDHERLVTLRWSPPLPREPCAAACLREWWYEAQQHTDAPPYPLPARDAAPDSGAALAESDLAFFGTGGGGGAAARPSLHPRMKVCHTFFDAPRTARRWRPAVRPEDVEEYRRHDLHGHLVRQLTQLGTPCPATHTGHWPSVLYVCERTKFEAAIESGAPVPDICGPEHILRMIAMLRRAVAPLVRDAERGGEEPRGSVLSPKLFDEALLHLLHFMHARFRTALERFECACRADVESAFTAPGGALGGHRVKAPLG